MKASLAKALSEDAIEKNDLIIEKYFSIILEYVFTKIKEECSRGYKSFVFNLKDYSDGVKYKPEIYDPHKNGDFECLAGPGQRRLMKGLRTNLQDLDYLVEVDIRGGLIIRWSILV